MVSVDSSAAPYCMAMERQKQNEMICSQNLIISRNEERRKNHIDDDERTAAAVNEGNEFIHSRLLGSPLGRMRDTMVLVPSLRGTIYKSRALSK